MSMKGSSKTCVRDKCGGCDENDKDPIKSSQPVGKGRGSSCRHTSQEVLCPCHLCSPRPPSLPGPQGVRIAEALTPGTSPA